MLSLLAGFILALNNATGTRAYIFHPETSPTYQTPNLPLLFDFSLSQHPNASAPTTPIASSYWTSSFITSTTGAQYLVISHLLLSSTSRSCYRASALNLHRPAEHTTYITYAEQPVVQPGPPLSVTVDGSGFAALTPDNVAQMRTFTSTTSDDAPIELDLTYTATSAALVNGGMGVFAFGAGRTYEWALPNCGTKGSVSINGQRVVVDPDSSFTWYDRQWSEAAAGAPEAGNWTWFELHIPGARDKLSVWAVDSGAGGRSRFATVRTADGAQLVVPVEVVADYSRQWDSNATGMLYPLDWVVTMGERGVFRIASIVGDQEIAGETAFFTAYEGFVTFDGQFEGQAVEGFGVVEMVTRE